MQQSNIIQVKDVTKVYCTEQSEFRALKGVSIDIKKGEFLIIRGKSGSGKSTLMHIIGCLDRPTSGTVEIGGKDTARMSTNELALLRNRYIGFVFQSFNLLSKTTALDNVVMPLIYAGIPSAKRKESAKEMLVSVGLGDKINSVPTRLSGGQQQRVAIARAMVTKPSLLLADEPTGNLDTRSGLEIMILIQKLNEQGVTVVIVTHELDIASFGKRMILLADGRIANDINIEQKSASEELKNLPTEEEFIKQGVIR